jgi:pimeloyl-ACP methyl ester carboxylesterase
MFVQTSYAATTSSTDASKIRFSNIQLRTGVRLHYAEQGDRTGPVVLMLHGFTDSWFSYSRVLNSMDPKYHVYVLDQRGHGNSDQPHKGYTPRELAGDVIAFINAMGIKDVTVVGHSMGSFVAQHVAALEPKRVKKLVLIGSAPSVKNAAVQSLKSDINALSNTVPEKFVRDFQVGLLVQPVPDDFMNTIIAESRRLPARLWKEVIKDLLTGADAELAKIKSPTLIVWGDGETVFLRKEQEALLSGISNSELRVYEKTGHSPTWEFPERVARDLQQFVDRE